MKKTIFGLSTLLLAGYAHASTSTMAMGDLIPDLSEDTGKGFWNSGSVKTILNGDTGYLGYTAKNNTIAGAAVFQIDGTDFYFTLNLNANLETAASCSLGTLELGDPTKDPVTYNVTIERSTTGTDETLYCDVNVERQANEIPDKPFIFKLKQTVNTDGSIYGTPYDLEVFTIAGKTYLAAPIYMDNLSYDDGDVWIYEWNDKSKEFSKLNTLGGVPGPIDVKHFRAKNSNDEYHDYLVVASSKKNDYKASTSSKLYKWNIDTNAFEFHKDILVDNVTSTHNSAINPQDMLVFEKVTETSSDTYLVIAYGGAYRETGANRDKEGYTHESPILKWDPVNTTFSKAPHDTFVTNNAFHLEKFTMNNKEYLGVSNHNNMTSTVVDSYIYEISATGTLDTTNTNAKRATTYGAKQGMHFAVGTENYMLFSNSYDSTNYSDHFKGPDVDATIHIWNGTEWVAQQHVNTYGAKSWIHIPITQQSGEQHYFISAEQLGYRTDAATVKNTCWYWDESASAANKMKPINSDNSSSCIIGGNITRTGMWKYVTIAGTPVLLRTNLDINQGNILFETYLFEE